VMIEMLRIYSMGFLENVSIEELTPRPFTYALRVHLNGPTFLWKTPTSFFKLDWSRIKTPAIYIPYLLNISEQNLLVSRFGFLGIQIALVSAYLH